MRARRNALALALLAGTVAAGCRSILGIDPLPGVDGSAGDASPADVTNENATPDGSRDASADGTSSIDGAMDRAVSDGALDAAAEVSCVNGCTPLGDAAGWTVQSSGTDAGLQAVWGVVTESLAESVYAVGSNATGTAGVILHSSGDGGWTADSLGTDLNGCVFAGVWASGPTDWYVTGNCGLIHSDGDGTWTTTLVTQPSQGVWGSSPNDVYVGTQYGIYHSTGNPADAGFILESSGAGQVVNVASFWGSGPNDVYAVGWGAHDAPDADLPGTYLLQRAEGSWSPVVQYDPTVQLAADFFGVWGSGPSDVYAVGGGAAPGVLHGGGDAGWADEPIPVAFLLNGVWGSGSSDIYAATSSGVLHSPGDGTWTLETLGPESLTLHSLWGSGPNDVFVVGSNGTIEHHP